MIISSRSKAKLYHRNWCPYAMKIDKKYRREVSESKLRSKGYTECSWCGGLHGIYLGLKWEPKDFGMENRGAEFFWDRKFKGLCIQTSGGFWKILTSWSTGKYSLYHLNHGEYDRLKTVKQRITGSYHRQHDVKQTENINTILHYIVDHDKAKKIMDEDYRKLPKKTPKQRKYFRQAKQRQRRKENRRVDALFKQIQNERNERK